MRFDVGEKLSLTLFLLLLSMLLTWYWNGALFLLLVLLRYSFNPFRPVSETSRRRSSTLARYLALVVILMTVVNGLLIKEAPLWPLPGGFTLSGEGIEFGLRTGMRLLVIAMSLLLFFGSTPIPRLAQFLQNIGWPVQLVMTLLLTLHFVETVPEKVSLIFTAQEARGAPVRASILARTRAFFLILSPLLLSGIVESIDRSMALELRGFHSGTKLSFRESSLPRARISVVGVLFLILSLLCIVWIILRWLLQ